MAAPRSAKPNANASSAGHGVAKPRRVSTTYDPAASNAHVT